MASHRRTVTERSAGGVVVRPRNGRPHVLLIRDPYRNWGLPKGHVEEGETMEAAALREVAEETGLGELELGGDLGEIDWFFRRGPELVHKFCRFFLMRSDRGEPEPERAEGITECRWVSMDRAADEITYPNTREVVREAARRLEAGAGGEDPPGDEVHDDG